MTKSETSTDSYSTSKDESFGKEFKLCLKNDIDLLFKTGKSVGTQNLRCKFLPQPVIGDNLACFQSLISVPKRNFKKAHDRNRIKRLLREVIRKNKTELATLLSEKKINLQFAIIFQQNVMPSYQSLNKEYSYILDQLKKKIRA